MYIVNRIQYFRSAPTASLYSQEAVLAIQGGCRATTRRLSFVYKKAVSVTISRTFHKEKQYVYLSKVV